jgi:dolichyl-phosphate beta-glucosyltransferase
VVDDGSRDGTGEGVKARGDEEVRVIAFPHNRGKGAAVRAGVAASLGERVLLSDADLSSPIEELEQLEPALEEGAFVVMGSRGLRDSRITIRQPFYREMMGKTFNRVLWALGLTAFRDTQCGFKLFHGDAARDIFSWCRVDGFAFDVESLYIARLLGYRVREIPVVWRHVPESRVHPVLDSGRMLWDSLAIRLSTRRRLGPRVGGGARGRAPLC